MATPTNSRRIVRRHEIPGYVGLSDTTVWRLIRAGDFPPMIALGVRSRGVLQADLDDWIASRAIGVDRTSAHAD